MALKFDMSRNQLTDAMYQQMAMEQQQADRSATLMKTPMMDPSKNPALAQELAPQEGTPTPPE